jgi:hemoglobin
MNFHRPHCLLLAATLALATATAAHAQATSSVTPLPNDALYQQFGGQPGLTKLMDEFVERLVVDPRTERFFKNANKPHLKAQLTDQLCEVSGGPCKLKGPAMADVHGNMGINKGDFNALVEVLQQTMNAQGIPFAAQNRMLAQLAPMHRDIITAE